MGWRAQRIVRVLWEGESSSETAGDEIKTPSGDPLMSLGELPLLALMIWSGLWIYWANDVYRLGLGFLALFKFFPRLLPHLRCGSPTGQRHGGHFFFMWFFALNGVVYMAYTLLSGEWRHLVPSRKSFREAILVALHDLRLWKGALPQQKYNGAQQIAYSSIILMGFGSLVTGLAIYKPAQFAWLTRLLGGYTASRFEHFLLALGYVLFFLIHIAQVIRAGWNNFRAMVSGHELVFFEEGTHE
jgi:thiosulfate reductase cytochrome b subunit